MDRRAKPKKGKAEAKRPLTDKSPKGDSAKVRDLEKRLAEAREQQTATSEILRVISSSPTDLDPVLDAVAESAVRLCEADDAEIYRVDGNVYRRVAHRGPVPIAGPLGEAYPINRGRPSSRAIVDRQTIHIHDMATEVDTEFPDLKAWREVTGVRTILATPLLREGVAIGVILIRRTEVKPFSDKHIVLLQTFADQAVIAIENVRLFTELETRNAELREALDHQTATAEVLAIISRSPTDVQPVFAAIARSAAGLCEAELSAVYRYDGELIHVVANTLRSSEQRDAFARLYPMPPGRGTPVARAVLERRTQHVPDTSDDPEYLALLASAGFRSALAVPMVREGAPIGAIAVGRMQVREFTAAQIQLLETFADQAVIAIENVRLFNETKEALERQTATSEILRVISQSPTDVQPVFDVVLASGVRLCGARFGGIFRFDGKLIHLVTSHEWPAEQLEALRRHFPMPPGDGSLAARAVRDRRVVQTPDYVAESRAGLLPEWVPGGEQRPRSTIAIPMLREGTPLGAIVLARAEPGAFSDQHVALLQTFAAQAVIAIENVRLFTELGARNEDLTRALDQQTATSEI